MRLKSQIMPRICSLILALLAGTLCYAAEQKLVFNLSTEPKSLDPHKANGVPEAHVILNLLEGLTRTDAQGNAVPAMAEKWDVSPDGRTYTFTLRKANWSNGEPVTADDFVYGWRHCLEPSTAGEYAYQLFFVEGAEDYNAGKSKDPATIGVKALAPDKLEVKLKAPTPFFPSVLAHYAYSPLKQSYVEAHPKWASTPEEYMVNGPFRMAEWKHADRLILKKNPAYYNAANVKLEEIVMPMITNESTGLMQFESGHIDYTEYIPLPDIPRLQKDARYTTAPYMGVYYVAFNNTRKPFDDARVRKAFALAVNRQQLVSAVLRAGQIPALAMVPPGITIEGGDFRKTTGDYFKEDVAEAKRLLAEAGYPGGKSFPKVKYLFNDMEMHRIIGQALQNMWLVNLGVKVDLDVQEWKVFLQNRKSLNYQMCRAGWIGDYLDPITFLDMFQTSAGNNDVGYKNPAYDKLIGEIQHSADGAKRLQLLRDAEKQIIGTDMVVAPLYFYIRQWVKKPSVQGIVSNPLGMVYFDKVTIGD
ncbi:MAG: peptide ABC transporter substrate-binding protein [Candidatus Sumerlaeaceae bacterium]|nr:peptide ABC transporter substrate-binding protein [Candidatus Sumerlaeaceae bacterium]